MLYHFQKSYLYYETTKLVDCSLNLKKRNELQYENKDIQQIVHGTGGHMAVYGPVIIIHPYTAI